MCRVHGLCPTCRRNRNNPQTDLAAHAQSMNEEYFQENLLKVTVSMVTKECIDVFLQLTSWPQLGVRTGVTLVNLVIFGVLYQPAAAGLALYTSRQREPHAKNNARAFLQADDIIGRLPRWPPHQWPRSPWPKKRSFQNSMTNKRWSDVIRMTSCPGRYFPCDATVLINRLTRWRFEQYQ